MTDCATALPSGVILAGGRAIRMGLPSKALAELAERPMIRHVLDRLAPQVGKTFISVQAYDSALEPLTCTQVPDLLRSHRGPLSGLYSAMTAICTETAGTVLLCPCDAPFLPRDLVSRLQRAMSETGHPVSVARYDGVLQPTFSLWDCKALGTVREAVTGQGRGGLRRLIGELPHAVVDWPEMRPPPFFNVNTPQDLATAAAMLDLRLHQPEDDAPRDI